jgi:hypothetical protein
LKDQSFKLKTTLVEYEQKYGFIDISRLQEKLCKEETERLRFELKCESLEQDLFDIRDSVMQATGKISKNLGK